MFDQSPYAPIQWINDPLLTQKSIRLAIKREDLIHEHVSGNKWRKLKYNFEAAKNNGIDTVLTFGGAYSNHISATAACAAENGFKSIGIIRGHELTPESNSTLRFARSQGMLLKFVTRELYRKKSDKSVLDQLKEEFGEFYLIPEGGTNDEAIRGTSEILNDQCDQFSHICVSAGTGGTAAGIINSAKLNQQVLVFPVVKGSWITNEINQWVQGGKHQFWTSIDQYHFGGYAKWNEQLIEFINTFKQQHQIPLDPIYTGKMLFGLFDMIKRDYFVKEATLLAIHTGGLQGIQGFNDRFGRMLI